MKEQFKTRQQLADELGVSPKTLYRKLKVLQIEIPRGLIPPKLYAEILERICN
ncbi:helix-turn-helix domain-containing protein [Dyadobacter luticola]|uniref:HTH domain-containing protein n=1 Tax=Dyadobacter luticola TaxID=1979387 RepID=A0A5R9KS16_9BACT|nr:helix-turn-helix domain-containing protein [Dyadobacter luticola]TLU99010.1 HTH domain-containing protein [Dyadobacter luticola]